jgi:DNA helicase II / ATP-dependent DNA helicase PcrA
MMAAMAGKQLGDRRVRLSDAQRRAVEWGDGPLMVLAGAGTGKTTVVVERVAHLLEREPDLAPESVLVLTYNVRAAAELRERLERRLGVERASRLAVHNFHSFGYRLLRDHRAEAGLAADADLLDGVGQRLLLRELRPRLAHLLYHNVATNPGFVLGGFADMISRAKDELVTPAEFAAHVGARKDAFAVRHGVDAYEAALDSLRERDARRSMWPVRDVRRALLSGGDREADRAADRAARREASGIGYAVPWEQLDLAQQDLAEGLKATFLRDAEAYEVLRLAEEAEVYGLYQHVLAQRGQLDFGEQMLRAIALLQERPNLLVRAQRRFRHVLVDEFQDANMAQILLLELVGRGPGKPDNVVVVGDDDQSIYRFRGASYAAFERFRERFGQPPAWDPARAAQEVASVPLLENRRSSGRILAASSRLIGHNAARLKRDHELVPTLAPGHPVQVVVASGEEDEAEAIVEWLRGTFEALPEPRRWSDLAVLYRRHRHRDLIVDRLRRAGVPHTVVGATGLFLQPEVRDLEAALRVLADPDDSTSFARLLTAGPWRLDAVELLAMRRAAGFDARPMLPVARELLGAGNGGEGDATDGGAAAGPTLRAKLGRLFGVIEDLLPRAMREGPQTMLEELVVRMSLLHDLVAVGTPDAQRQALSVARFMRFAADHQRTHPRDSVADFVTWLDLYQEVGGDLDLDVPAATAADGVQLMTVHQAKGLEYRAVVVPRVVEGQFPDSRGERQLLPLELLKQRPPEQFQVDEERRLMYVAMTRARERLLVTTVEEPGGQLRPSRFVGEVAPGAGETDRGAAWRGDAASGTPDDVAVTRRAAGPEAEVEHEGPADGAVALERLMPVPAAFERRHAMRRRAVELIGLLEQLDPADADGRAALAAELAAVAADAAGAAEEARRDGVDPLTLRVLARHAPAGRVLLQLAPHDGPYSHSAFETYRQCGLRFAFQRVYRVPVAERKGFLTYGSAAHAAFEAFAIARRDAQAAGEAPPGFEALRRAFDEAWAPESHADRQEAEHYRQRSETLLRRFYETELASLDGVVAVERGFAFELDAGEGEPPVRVVGTIDRIDRLPDGSIEVIDYKTGYAKGQADVDRDAQLSTYALALARGAVADDATGVPLPAPSRLTLFFTEAGLKRSTTRSPEQLEAHATELVALARRIRDGDFTAQPEARRCSWCDYRRLCPSRAGATEG